MTWPDDWTSTTLVSVKKSSGVRIYFSSPPLQDGKRSAQFEHTMVVTDTGCDVLTGRRDHDGLPHFLTSSF